MNHRRCKDAHLRGGSPKTCFDSCKWDRIEILYRCWVILSGDHRVAVLVPAMLRARCEHLLLQPTTPIEYLARGLVQACRQRVVIVPVPQPQIQRVAHRLTAIVMEIRHQAKK